MTNQPNTFARMTESFFDEYSRILDAQKKAKEDGIDMRSDSPYSSLLTQDEEPLQEYNPNQLEYPQPEVITR